MSYLHGMAALGLRANWRTLLTGLEGPAKYHPVVTLDDVCAFACEQLVVPTTPISEDAVASLVASSDEPMEVHRLLRLFAEREKSDAELELRKWRLMLLRDIMSHLPGDPLYGLLALTEFWERFDFPPDSPHVVQGRGNHISPAAYFTEENYRDLVGKHHDWIEREAAALRT